MMVSVTLAAIGAAMIIQKAEGVHNFVLPAAVTIENDCTIRIVVSKGTPEDNFLALYETEAVHLDCAGPSCDGFVVLKRTAQKLRLYSSQALISVHDLPAAALTCTESIVSKSASSLRVGALYEGWQGFAASSMSAVAAKGGVLLSVEDVLRSNGTDGIGDIFDKWNVTGNDGFFYQDEPQLGYYCIYRKRPDEPVGIIPDCPNITGTLAAQLTWLAAAGVDFITADGTNLCTPGDEGDVLQTRPMEVLFEEWTAFRARGVSTPFIAAWQRSVTGCTLWQNVLDLYNNATYEPLVLKDTASGKKVFFVPDSPDAGIVAQIESNGGRNDVVVQEMWALFPYDLYAQGRWAFMSPCTAMDAKGQQEYTTNAVSTGAGAGGCGQLITSNSSLGTCTSVSPSYQLSYGSVPFSAAGKFGTLTLKRQFGTIFDAAAEKWAATTSALKALQSAADRQASAVRVTDGARGALPDNIYMSSWNEFISQPQPNPFGGPYSFSMGLGSAGPAGPYTKLFVDTYGTAIGRDIEPTKNGGNATFLTLASCVRVVRLGEALAQRASVAISSAANEEQYVAALAMWTALTALFGSNEGRLTSCGVEGEACCTFNETSDGYAVVYSLTRSDAGDALVTTDVNELGNLTCPSCGWTQVCNAYGGPTTFCVDGGLATTFNAVRGPFVLHSAGCGAATTGVNGTDPTVKLQGRVPVYRCRSNASGGHFLSGSPNCGTGSVLECTIGCADSALSSNMPRLLRVCIVGSAVHGGSTEHGAPTAGYYHTLDYACNGGDSEVDVLGYVH